jgi:hypothetical protein
MVQRHQRLSSIVVVVVLLSTDSFRLDEQQLQWIVMLAAGNPLYQQNKLNDAAQTEFNLIY